MDNNKRNFPTKRPQKEFETIMEGKLPPMVPDLEEAVLGAILLEKNSIQNILDILTPECFYVDAHKEIFRVVRYMYSNGQPIDILTVTEELKKQGQLEIVGGAYFVTKLTNRVSSAANMMSHSMIIIEKYILREFIKIAGELGSKSFDDDANPWEIKDDISNRLMVLTDVSGGKQVHHISKTMADVIKKAEEAESVQENKTDTIGVMYGFSELDRMTNGAQRGDLVIIAARTSMGKTAFVLNIARNAAKANKGVLIFTLEMTHIQMGQRFQSAETGIPMTDVVRANNLSWETMNDGVNKLSELPMWIDDRANISIAMVESTGRKFKKQHNIELIIVDYLQLIKGSEDIKFREAQIADISKRLKQLAKELDIPIIALAQVGRQAEQSDTKKPQLSHIRESASIEMDADLVAFLYRFEYYFANELDKAIFNDGREFPPKNLAELIIAKHRNGPLGSIPLKFYGYKMLFTDYEDVFDEHEEQKSLPEYNPTITPINDDIEDEVPPF